jgi:hypothetical protein
LPTEQKPIPIGMIFGGFVPAATWILMRESITSLHIGVVAGGAIFSSITVFEWARAVFRNVIRALAFAILIESTMLFAQTAAISIMALILLIVINSTSSAVHLLCEDQRSLY